MIKISADDFWWEWHDVQQCDKIENSLEFSEKCGSEISIRGLSRPNNYNNLSESTESIGIIELQPLQLSLSCSSPHGVDNFRTNLKKKRREIDPP